MTSALLRFCFALLLSIACLRAADNGAPQALVWDATEKTAEAKSGELEAILAFKVTNTSERARSILSVSASCRCTQVELAETPLALAPGASTTIRVFVNFTGKTGTMVQPVFVQTSEGMQILQAHVKISGPSAADEATRARNREIALADRQAVFRGDCAACHVEPARGKQGEELFHAACGICHTAAQRASMVPDLLVAREPRDAAYWLKWIAEGKEGSLMPAFAEQQGGPLTEEQIASLVEFALQRLPTQPRNN